jgi:hypothetical protein
VTLVGTEDETIRGDISDSSAESIHVERELKRFREE